MNTILTCLYCKTYNLNVLVNCWDGHWWTLLFVDLWHWCYVHKLFLVNTTQRKPGPGLSSSAPGRQTTEVKEEKTFPVCSPLQSDVFHCSRCLKVSKKTNKQKKTPLSDSKKYAVVAQIIGQGKWNIFFKSLFNKTVPNCVMTTVVFLKTNHISVILYWCKCFHSLAETRPMYWQTAWSSSLSKLSHKYRQQKMTFPLLCLHTDIKSSCVLTHFL